MKIKYADLHEINYFKQKDLFTGATSVDDKMIGITIIYCRYCGAENRLPSDIISDNTSGIFYCINCNQPL